MLGTSSPPATGCVEHAIEDPDHRWLLDDPVQESTPGAKWLLEHIYCFIDAG
jgi:hypothetical protein